MEPKQRDWLDDQRRDLENQGWTKDQISKEIAANAKTFNSPVSKESLNEYLAEHGLPLIDDY